MRMLAVILVTACATLAEAQEKARFTNFEDLRWLATNASKIGAQRKTVPTYPQGGIDVEWTWFIACNRANGLEPIKLLGDAIVLFPLIEVIDQPDGKTHAVFMKGYLSRQLRLRGEMVNLRGVFTEALDIGVPRIESRKLQSYEDEIHNETNAVQILDALVSNCRQRMELELKK